MEYYTFAKREKLLAKLEANIFRAAIEAMKAGFFKAEKFLDYSPLRNGAWIFESIEISAELNGLPVTLQYKCHNPQHGMVEHKLTARLEDHDGNDVYHTVKLATDDARHIMYYTEEGNEQYEKSNYWLKYLTPLQQKEV